MDEAPPTDDDEQGSLKWRGDPSETFSDWKIVIVFKSEHVNDDSTATDEPEGERNVIADTILPLEQTYHVHKYILGFGTRRSDYFSRLFRNGASFKESECNTSRIELDLRAAEAFPNLLDYLYEPKDKLKISAEDAVPLVYLGEYFEMKHLRWEAHQFCKKNISLDNMHIYYTHAAIFHNEPILDLISKFLGENIMKVHPSCPILKHANPQLWVNTFGNVRDISKTRVSFHISKLVVEVSSLTADTFSELAEPEKIPHVDPGAALALCEIEDAFLLSGREDKAVFLSSSEEHCDDESSKKCDATTVCSTRPLTSLQERCATALSQKWWKLDDEAGTNFESLQHRQSFFLVDLLLKSIREANVDLEKSEEQMAEKEHTLRKTNAVLALFKPLQTDVKAHSSVIMAIDNRLVELRPRLKGQNAVYNSPGAYEREQEGHCLFFIDPD